MRGGTKQHIQACGNYLQSSPLTFLSIEVGIGYLLSRLTCSNSRTRRHYTATVQE